MKRALPLLLGSGLLVSCHQTQLRNCESSYRVPDTGALTAALASARSRWAAAGIQDYTYTRTFDASALVSGTEVTTVRGGQVVAGSDTSSGEAMDDLFARLTRTLARAAQPDSCVMVGASYDQSDGHILPSEFTDAQKGLQDAFGSYRVTSFRRD